MRGGLRWSRRWVGNKHSVGPLTRYYVDMWWRKKDRPEKPLREQLIEARDNVRRQIEVLRAGPSSVGTGVGDFTDNASLIADLSNTLRELESDLANLGPSDS